MSKVDPPAYQIFTAIGVLEGDEGIQSPSTQPLLLDEENREVEHIDDGTIPPRQISEVAIPYRIIVLGIFTGFITHAIAFGANAYKTILFHSVVQPPPGLNEDWSKFACLSILSHVDVAIYPLVWILFVYIMTSCGLKTIQRKIGQRISQRYLFILGVYYLVGIIMGAFLTWAMADFFMDFPISLESVAISVIFDFLLCCAMVWCFDAAREDEEEEEELGIRNALFSIAYDSSLNDQSSSLFPAENVI